MQWLNPFTPYCFYNLESLLYIFYPEKEYAICKLHRTINEYISYALILIYVDFICGVFPDVKNQGCNNYSDQQKQPEKRKKD